MALQYDHMKKDADISVLVGKTITTIYGPNTGSLPVVGDDEVHFYTDDGKHYALYHYQDCCESVSIEDIAGEWDDLTKGPIRVAEVVQSSDVGFTEPPPGEWDDAREWTFYRLATERGFVVLRWYGSSNGYYSTEVSFIEVLG